MAEAAKTPGSWKVTITRDLGLTLLLNTDNYIDFLIDRDGNYESSTAAAITRALNEGIGAFIDVGSHIGLHSLQVAKRFPEVSVLALEPVPENLAQQRANMLINDLAYDLAGTAASEVAGELTLYMGRRDTPDVDYGKYNSGFASVIPDEFHDLDSAIRVPAAKLDDLAAGLDKSHGLLVKIDAEGAESRVISGMTGLMEKVPRMSIVIELLFDRWSQECVDIEANLRERGFRMQDLTGRALGADDARHSANYLFTRG